eukprot:6194226-Pleurochrysis_carterae.AAC.1
MRVCGAPTCATVFERAPRSTTACARVLLLIPRSPALDVLCARARAAARLVLLALEFLWLKHFVLDDTASQLVRGAVRQDPQVVPVPMAALGDRACGARSEWEASKAQCSNGIHCIAIQQVIAANTQTGAKVSDGEEGSAWCALGGVAHEPGAQVDDVAHHGVLATRRRAEAAES